MQSCMDQQIAPTLWLPPGMCVLNPLPAMQFHPTTISPNQMPPQMLKTSVMTVPAHAGLVHNAHLLQQPQILPPAQNVIHIPIENLLLPSAGEQQYELPPPVLEIPYTAANIQTGNPVSIPTGTPSIPNETSFQKTPMNPSKVFKKRRISPSAKRRSRLRLIAFLEQKRKQQDQSNLSTTQKPLQSTNAIASYCNDVTTSPSINDLSLLPKAT